MFEQLFERPHALARHHASPLFEERRRFLVYVADRGVSRDTLRHIADYLLRIIEALDLAKRPHKSITRDEIKRKSVDGAFASVASLDTTNIYAEVDLEMKAKALANCAIDGKSGKTMKPCRENKGLMEFLKTL